MDYKKAIEKVLNESIEMGIIDGYIPTDTAPPKNASTQKKKKSPGNKGNAGNGKPKRDRPSNRRSDDQKGRNSGDRRSR